MERRDMEIMARRQRTAEEIEAAMKANGLNRKEFARMMHRQPSEVTKWLSGKHNFTSDLLAEISVVLNVPVSGASDRVYPTGAAVSGYCSGSEGSTRDSLQEPAYALAEIDLPMEDVKALIEKAKRKGLSLREYVKAVLKADAMETPVSAYDFCGIWSDDCPDKDELLGLRTYNSIREL